MVFLGGAALMLWFRDQGWHWAGALIAALAFCYGASMAWRIQHIGQVLSLAYLPIAMLCLDRALARALDRLRRRGGRRRGAHRAGARPGRPARRSICWPAFGALAPPRRRSARSPRCAQPAAAGGRRGVRACADRRARAADGAAGRRTPTAPPSTTSAPARGSLHPALLLTLVVPEVFGASGRMEDYWGPPSFAWPDTGLFLAQNMGQLYIGAIPLLLLLLAALRGQLWAREIRFFTVAAASSCCSTRSAGTRRSSACSTSCCPASACTAGRPTPPS